MNRDTPVSKGYEMRSALLYIRRMSESIPRWTSIRNLLLNLGLVVMMCGVFGVQRGHSQTTDQNCSAGNPDKTCAQGDGSQTPSAPDDGAQKTDQNCSAGNPDEACTSGDGSETPSAAANGAQRTDRNSGAKEASPEASTQSDQARAPGMNSGAQTSSPNSPSKATSSNAAPTETDSQNLQSEPQEIQQRSPYKNLPSLYDLYTQIPAAGGN